MVRLAVNCKQRCRQLSIDFCASGFAASCFATIQGSFSCMYLFPLRLRSITSNNASRNLYSSKRLSTFSFALLMSSINVLSFSSKISSCSLGTLPPHNLCINTHVLFTKLPNMLTSSLLFLS